MPSSFTSRLVVEPLPDGRGWKLEKKFSYHVGSEDSGIEIRVPAGFVTDFASIPQAFWSFGLAPYGVYGKVAVLHDWLYQTAKVSRAMADAVLLEGMWVLGVPWWKRWVIYSFVRMFGWMFFPSKRREHIEEKIEEHAEQHQEDIKQEAADSPRTSQP